MPTPDRSQPRGFGWSGRPRRRLWRESSRGPVLAALILLPLAGLPLAGCQVLRSDVLGGGRAAARGEVAACPDRMSADPTLTRAAIGTAFTCQCGPTQAGVVRGTGVYAATSHICAAALHDGVIGPDGGPVTLKVLSGSPFYRGSARNGIVSLDAEAQARSFAFMGEAGEEAP